MQDKIKEYLNRNFPQHVGGYNNGWIGESYFDGGVHLYSSGRIFGTVLN